MTYYQKGFAERYPMLNPRYVEAWLRLTYGTLSNLDWSDMDREVKIVRPIIENDPAECERLAVSMGL